MKAIWLISVALAAAATLRGAEQPTPPWTAGRLPADDPAVAEAQVALGDRYFEAGRIAEAVECWRQVEANHAHSGIWPKAVFNIGVALKSQGKFREAIGQFQKLLAADVNDRGPGGNAPTAYRNDRRTAQLEIGHCRFALGEYQAALDAYRTARAKYPFNATCGTCMDDDECDCDAREGLCRDWLGDTAGALKDYYRATLGHFLASADPEVLSRILDIYEAAGKLDAWQRILDEADQRLLARVEREARSAGSPFDTDKARQTLQKQIARQMLAIRDLGVRKQWPPLVAMLGPARSSECPLEPGTRRTNWEAAEAARLLARDPAAAVPLLKAHLSPQTDNTTSWINYALGLCGTQEAVDVLLSQVPNDYREQNIIVALSVAGEPGRKAIAGLEARGIARQYIDQYRKHTALFRLSDRSFPPVPRNVKVPERLVELDEQAAAEAALPKSVPLDQSTPAATVRTMLQAMVIADSETFMKCTDGSPRWKVLAENLARRGERHMSFEVGEPKLSGDSAEVSIKITDPQHTESGVIIVVRKDGRWIATETQEPPRGNP